MKLESKYFDKIRVKPEEDRLIRDKVPECDVPGCTRPGKYPAPKGRDNEGEYHYFCLEHVREYNKGYNYFTGMQDDDVRDWQKRDQTGHRPTWRLGQNSWAVNNGGKFRDTGGFRHQQAFDDPFDVLGEGHGEQHGRPQRAVRNAELSALHKMGLDETATPEQVKNQYKTLVKRLHPDANGGSRENEDKLREIIQAYDYLKSAGFC